MKNYIKIGLSIICCITLMVIYFNVGKIDLTREIAEDQSLEYTVHDNVSFHHGSSVDTIMNNLIESTLDNHLAPETTQRQTIFWKENIFHLERRLDPHRCGTDIFNGKSELLGHIKLFYNLNMDSDTINASVVGHNIFELDINLDEANVHFEFTVRRILCDDEKWKKIIKVNAGKVRLKAKVELSFNGNEFIIKRIFNEEVVSIEWPTITGDADLVESLLNWGVETVEWVCTEIDCINTFVLPELESKLKWDKIIKSIVNENLLDGLKGEINEDIDLKTDNIKVLSNIQLENMGFSTGSSAVLISNDASFEVQSDICAANIEMTNYRGELNNMETPFSYIFGSPIAIKMGMAFVEGLVFAKAKEGLFCINFPINQTIGRKSINETFLIRPYGQLRISSGSYSYDLIETYTKSQYRFGVTPGNRVSETKLPDRTDRALKIELPVRIIPASEDSELSSNAEATLTAYVKLETKMKYIGKSKGVDIVLKTVELNDLKGGVTLNSTGTTIPLSTIYAASSSFFDQYKEKRTIERAEKKCHSDDILAKNDDPSLYDSSNYYISEDDDTSIYYEEMNTRIKDCAKCSIKLKKFYQSEINLNNYFISDEEFFDNGTYAIQFLRNGFPYGESFNSTEKNCPPLKSDQLDDDITEGKRSVDDRINYGEGPKTEDDNSEEFSGGLKPGIKEELEEL